MLLDMSMRMQVFCQLDERRVQKCEDRLEQIGRHYNLQDAQRAGWANYKSVPARAQLGHEKTYPQTMLFVATWRAPMTKET